MTERPTESGAPPAGGPTTDFDDEDELLVRLFEHCSPEQKLRGSTPREVLATLTPAERGQLLGKLVPSVRDVVRRWIGR